MWPVTIIRKSLRQVRNGGSKDYHLVLISTHDNRSMVIERFGKAGQWGIGFEVATFNTVSAGESAFRNCLRQKLDRQYKDQILDKKDVVADVEDLKIVLGRYWYGLGKDNADWLVPGVDVSGIKRDERAQYTQNGTKWERVEKAPLPVRATVEDRLQENEQWGLF